MELLRGEAASVYMLMSENPHPILMKNYSLRQIKAQIATWKSAATPTASDIALKESRLNELQQEIDRMELQQRQARGDYYPGRTSLATDKSMASLTSALEETIVGIRAENGKLYSKEGIFVSPHSNENKRCQTPLFRIIIKPKRARALFVLEVLFGVF